MKIDKFHSQNERWLDLIGQYREAVWTSFSAIVPKMRANAYGRDNATLSINEIDANERATSRFDRLCSAYDRFVRRHAHNLS